MESIRHEPVGSEMLISVARGVDVTSVITESAAKGLDPKKGSEIYAVINASNIIIASD